MVYTLDITPAQESIVEKLESIQFEWGKAFVIADGLHDTDDVPKFANSGGIKPFIVVHFGSPHRHYRGRNMGSYKLDTHRATVIIECVANNGTTARVMQNIITDELVGWKPDNGGALVKYESSWEGSRALLDSNSRPSRWVTNTRFSFGVTPKHSL